MFSFFYLQIVFMASSFYLENWQTNRGSTYKHLIKEVGLTLNYSERGTFKRRPARYCTKKERVDTLLDVIPCHQDGRLNERSGRGQRF